MKSNIKTIAGGIMWFIVGIIIFCSIWFVAWLMDGLGKFAEMGDMGDMNEDERISQHYWS